MFTNHKYSVGDQVVACLRDWSPDGLYFSRLVRAEIVSKVYNPLGYNVRLSEPATFEGHVPFPFTALPVSAYILDSPVKGTRLQVVFIREFDLSQEAINLHRKLQEFMTPLVFRVIKVVHTKPANQIEYINYFAPDGQVTTIPDDRKFSDDAGKNRLAYKVSHFFGFAHPFAGQQQEDFTTADKDMHFTMNRFSEPDFWNGLQWSDIDRSKAFRPEKGTIICGSPPALATDQAPSYDHWFVCSPQFMFLRNLICHGQPRVLSDTDVIARLIIPENVNNLYIPHEIPPSRYLYAAIYMLVIKEVKTLPTTWQLPTMRNPKTFEIEPFEVWWPAKFK